MITLCMDTSHILLVLALVKDGKLIGHVQKESWKRQSEEIFPALIDMMNRAGVATEEIDQIVVTRGPGSYTGVRIAMTVAKVFCSMRDIPIYTLPTMLLYAGREEARVIMDARGGRVYTCAYKDGKAVEEERAEAIQDLLPQIGDKKIIGDGRLVGKEDNWPDMCEHFIDLQDEWKKADNVHLVVPEYLKPSTAYLVKKQ